MKHAKQLIAIVLTVIPVLAEAHAEVPRTDYKFKLTCTLDYDDLLLSLADEVPLPDILCDSGEIVRYSDSRRYASFSAADFCTAKDGSVLQSSALKVKVSAHMGEIRDMKLGVTVDKVQSSAATDLAFGYHLPEVKKIGLQIFYPGHEDLGPLARLRCFVQ